MSLSRQNVVDAALEVLDRYGLEDLSMRRLADLLGVKAGALYWHVANKQTLLALMGDQILGGPEGPGSVAETGGQPADGIRRWARSLREALLRHRDGAELVASTLPVGLGTVDPVGGLRAALRGWGLSAKEARSSSRALVHFVLGHVTEEQTGAQLSELGVVETFDAAAEEEDFSAGLELLVAGICGLRADRAGDGAGVENIGE